MAKLWRVFMGPMGVQFEVWFMMILNEDSVPTDRSVDLVFVTWNQQQNMLGQIITDT